MPTARNVVSRDDWTQARLALLAREKEFTRLRDQLSAERRSLPWVRLEKEYVFEGPDGKETLARALTAHRLSFHARPRLAGRM